MANAVEPQPTQILRGAALFRTPWYHGWNIIAVSLLFQAVIVGVLITSFTFFAEQWVAEFGVARSQIAFAVSMPNIGAALLGPIAGRAMDKGSVRFFVVAGVLLYGLACLLISWVGAPWQILAVYGTIVPFTVIFAAAMPAQILATRWFADRRGLAIGIVTMGVSLGGAVGPAVVTALIGALGWRAALQCIALFCVVILVPLVLAIVRDTPPDTGQDDSSPREPVQSAGARAILSARNFWLLVSVGTLIMTASAGLVANLAHFTSERGLSLAQATLLLSFYSGVAAAIKFVWGMLADRIEHRFLLSASAAAVALGFAVLAFAEGFAAIFGAYFIIGLAVGGLFPLLGASLASQFGSQSFGQAMGLATLFLPLSGIGAPLVAWLRELTGSYTAVLLTLSLLLLGAALIAPFMRYKKA